MNANEQIVEKRKTPTKRKRPESFIESDLKRHEIEKEGDSSVDSSPTKSRSRSRKKTAEPVVYASLAATLAASDDEDIQNGNVVMRRKGNRSKKERPKSLSTIDGRKRPTSSKSIEELLYPLRFSQQDLSKTPPVTPTKTDFKLLFGPKAQPYAKAELVSNNVETFPNSVLSSKNDQEEFVDPKVIF